MENNEIMSMDEVLNTNGASRSSIDLKSAAVGAAVIGGGILLGRLLYKKVIKPAAAKIAAKAKDEDAIEAEYEEE